MKPGMTMITLRMPVTAAEILRTRAKSIGLSVNAYCMLILVINWIPSAVLSKEALVPETLPSPVVN